MVKKKSPATPSIPVIHKDDTLKVESVYEPVETSPQEKTGTVIFLLGTLFAFLIFCGTIFLGFLYQQSQRPKSPPSPTLPSPTPLPTSAIETDLIKNDEITFEVLNASGVTGQAAKYKTKLENLGYKVIAIGNGTGKHRGFEVYLSAKLVTQKDRLISDIQKNMPSATYSGELVDSTASAQLIVGQPAQ